MGLLAFLRCRVPTDRVHELMNSSDLFPQDAKESEEPISFASYNRSASWWRPDEIRDPLYGVRKGHRNKWRTSSYLALGAEAATTVVYLMYFEEP